MKMSSVTSLLRYGKRALNLLPEFVIGTGADTVGAAMRSTKGSIWTKVKQGAVALEKDIAKKSVKNGGFFRRTLKEILGTPKAVVTSAKAGARAAKIAGKSATKGLFKGGIKAISKRMPGIGALLTVAFEAPNIYRAFKDGGVMAGVKEIGGAGVELGAMAAGAAIGSAICPGIGTIIGGIIGGIGGALIRGKTYTEKQEEAAAETEETQGTSGSGEAQPVQYSEAEIANLKKLGLTDETISEAQQCGYTYNDIIAALQEEDSAQSERATEESSSSQVESNTSTNTDKYKELQEENEKLKKELEAAQQQYQPIAYQEMIYNPYSSNGTYINPFMTGMYSGQAGGNYTNDFMSASIFGGNNYSTVNPYQNLWQNQYFKYNASN
jgi:hypothetical protein